MKEVKCMEVVNKINAIHNKTILSLIKAVTDNNDEKAKNHMREIAHQFRENGNGELSEYVLGLIGDVRTFEITD
jgi:hypothetical protein